MDRRHALMLLGGTAAGLGASLGFGLLPAAACELFPRGGGWRFLVLRHGNAIGEHVFRFSRRDGDFVVEVAIDIAVEMLGITVFRFTHRAEEVWRRGWLHSLVSATDDDGTLWRLQAERSDDALRGRVNDVAFSVSGFIVPASLWHRDTTKSRALLDTIDGRLKMIDSEALGEDAVSVAGAKAPASHFRLTGQLERDVWYDADCAIARVAFPARDGSLITLERQ
ncbi:MAG TPA: DUF6134 family protein [Kiloniellaceae bacterium]